nr:SIR2 family protein [Delftia acidovorans]
MIDSKTGRRALILLGAGASVELGIPATSALTNTIDAAVLEDKWCAHTRGSQAYSDVRETLVRYYGSQDEAHFERVYHVLHQLAQLQERPTACPEFRPILAPFVQKIGTHAEQALHAAGQTMLRTIYARCSQACSAVSQEQMEPMAAFFAALERDYIPRVYTTNYDDFVWQATHQRYYTGFTREHDGHRSFDAPGFWRHWDRPSLFHLHGSIHLGYANDHDIGDLAWFDDRERAQTHAGFDGSGLLQMDGSQIERSAIITGLDKLPRLQPAPYAFYYSAFNRDVIEADLIIVIGSGMADLHLNSHLKMARRARPEVPLLYVGFWGKDPQEFHRTLQYQPEPRDLSLFHDLHIDLTSLAESDFRSQCGWTVAPTSKGAVWADGFQAFLRNPAAFASVLGRLTLP